MEKMDHAIGEHERENGQQLPPFWAFSGGLHTRSIDCCLKATICMGLRSSAAAGQWITPADRSAAMDATGYGIEASVQRRLRAGFRRMSCAVSPALCRSAAFSLTGRPYFLSRSAN